MAAQINHIESRRQSNDCAAWALKTYFGLSYEDVWQVVQKVTKGKGHEGLHTRQIMRVARLLGHPLTKVVLKRKHEFTGDEYGVLLVENKKDAHVVVLRNGLVFDTDATATDLDVWLAAKEWKLEALLYG